MKTRRLIPLLLVAFILGGCEEKPYRPPLPHTSKELQHQERKAPPRTEETPGPSGGQVQR